MSERESVCVRISPRAPSHFPHGALWSVLLGIRAYPYKPPHIHICTFPVKGIPLITKHLCSTGTIRLFETCVQPGTFSVFLLRLSDEFQSTGLSAATHPVYLFLCVLAVCFPAETQLSPRVRRSTIRRGVIQRNGKES